MSFIDCLHGHISGARLTAVLAPERNLIDEIVPSEDFFALYALKFAQMNKFKEIEYIGYKPKAALAPKLSRRVSKLGCTIFEGFLDEAKKNSGALQMERN